MVNGVMLAKIFGFILLGLIYILFLSVYVGFAPYWDAFTCLALLLALFSALIFKSKTKLFKIVSIIFFMFTLYKLISYRMDWNTFEDFERVGCIDENLVLKDLKEKGIIGDWEYQYSDNDEKCLLKEGKTKIGKDGVTNG